MIKIEPHASHRFSPLRYPGGKSSLLPFLDRILKTNELCSGTYIEPFAGGAGAALGLLLLEKVEKIIINDLDPAVYAFWRSSIEQSDKFISRLMSIRLSMAEWKRQRDVYRNKKASLFDLGFATFFLNRTNHSGIIGGGPIGGIKQRGAWGIGARFNRDALAEKIERIALYKSRIKVFHSDGLKLVAQYKKINKTFIYLDPPYYLKGSCLYLNHYGEKDHIALANLLNTDNESKWLLTYDNVAPIRKLYSSRRSQCFSLNYSARTPSKGREIMIFSDAVTLPN